MHAVVFVLLGSSIVLLATWDLFWTTLGEGGGPLTRRVGKWTWSAIFRLHRHWSKSRLLSAGGILIILATVSLWILMAWVGWALIFSAQHDAVYSTVDERPADLWERLYFTGYMLSTLGIGDIQPRGSAWRVLTAIASISGLFQISFSIAYLIPLALAATFKRKIATSISCMGKTADDVILNMWNGEDWNILNQFLQHLTPELALLNHQHLTYPVLHYFHSTNRPAAIGPSLATLDEALSIVEYGMEEGYGPDPGAFHAARRMISDFLQTLDSAFEDPQAETPPAPTLARLREEGVPVVSDDDFQRCVGEMEERRRLLRALLQNDAWQWDIVRAPTREDDTGDEKEALSEVEAI